MSTPSSYEEKELLARIAEGDQQAFTTLFLHHRGRIYTTVHRLTASRLLAEEVLQDVFLKIWIKRVDLAAVSDFEAYLHTIARRAAYRVLRQLTREKQLFQRHPVTPEEPAFHITGENLLQLKQYQFLLKEAIERLPPKQRETYLLIKEKGLKREEAATLLKVSAETVKYNVEEATRKIRAYFMAYTDLLPVLLLFVPSLKNIF